jgi:soluble lytic murein transglycosylase-like protein
MRIRALLLTLVLLALVPASAQATVPHTVQPGETLWSIATANGISTQTLAAANGISSEAHVIIGTTVQVPSAGTTASTTATGGSADVGTIAARYGVPASLANAIAHQESGFNNSMVSATGARGVMQVMPDTFDYVDDVLDAGQQDPSSPQQNITAGVLYLRQLLREFGFDQRQAVAAYYQGAASVRQRGMFADTQQYVANVMALKARYGG